MSLDFFPLVEEQIQDLEIEINDYLRGCRYLLRNNGEEFLDNAITLSSINLLKFWGNRR